MIKKMIDTMIKTKIKTMINTRIKDKEKSNMNAFLLRLLLCISFVPFMSVLLCGQSDRDSRLFSPASDTTFSGFLGSGARAFGMGGAFIAIADDATAASWNPGGLGQLEKPELSFVSRYQNYRTLHPAQIINPDYVIGPQDNDGNALGFDFISFTYPFRIGELKIVPQISYQRSIGFDIKTRMNNVRRMLTTPDYFLETYSNETQDFSGGIDTVSFSIGTKIFKRVNIGFSANIMINGLKGEEISHSTGILTPVENPPVKQKIESLQNEKISAKMDGFNVNIGVLIDVADNFKIGAVYKSATTLNLDYNVSRTTTTTASGIPATDNMEYGAIKSLRWPQTIGIGLSYRPSDPLTLYVDFTSTRWSKAIIRNFFFKDEEKKDVVADVYFPTFSEVPIDARNKQVDTMQVRGGMEYIVIGKKNVLIPIRFGLFADTQYYTDSTGKKVTLFGVTGGVGLKKGAFSFDIAAMYEFGNYLKSDYDYSETLFADFRIYGSIIISL